MTTLYEYNQLVQNLRHFSTLSILSKALSLQDIRNFTNLLFFIITIHSHKYLTCVKVLAMSVRDHLIINETLRDQHMVHTSEGITSCNHSCLCLRSPNATTQDDRHCRQLNKTLLLTCITTDNRNI